MDLSGLEWGSAESKFASEERLCSMELEKTVTSKDFQNTEGIERKSEWFKI